MLVQAEEWQQAASARAAGLLPATVALCALQAEESNVLADGNMMKLKTAPPGVLPPEVPLDIADAPAVMQPM